MGELYKRSYQDKSGRTKMAPRWYADYVDGSGVRKRVSLFKDKSASLAKLAELERTADRTRAGLTDKFEDWRKVPLAQHLTDWKRSLAAQGVVDGGDLTTRRAERLVVEAKAVFIADMVPSKFAEALERMTKADGLSAQTSNHYLGAVKQFVRWLEGDGRIEANPLRHLKGKGVKHNLVHDRRAFTPEEAEYLLLETSTAKRLGGLSGEDRAWLYRLALTTGLRAKELWSLTPESFQDGFVTILAGNAKNRKEDCLPIPETIKELLMAWLAAKPKNKKIFDTFGKLLTNGRTNTAMFSKSLKRDMLKARQAWLASGGVPESNFLLWKDPQGQFADFHCLRVSAITWAVASGANPKTVQAFARHSTITLTMDRYCKTPKGGELVGISNGLGEKLTAQPPLVDTGKGFYCAVTVPLLCPKGAIQKTRLISIDATGQKVVPAKTSGKQAFGGVLSRKKEEGPPGFEPGNNGFANRCLTTWRRAHDYHLKACWHWGQPPALPQKCGLTIRPAPPLPAPPLIR